MKKPIDSSELIVTRFIAAPDLKGREVTVTMVDIDTEELENAEGVKDLKGIVSLKETGKQWVLNKTNRNCLDAMFTTTLAAWKGKRVTIYATRDRGKDCIRIKGSPDIEGPVDATVPAARGKTKQIKMQKTGKE